MIICVIPGGTPLILIVYTTLYRDGGNKFKRAAETMAKEKQVEQTGVPVRCTAVEDKASFVKALTDAETDGQKISELHFIGHSGMYGPMFRTTSMPEQFSPHEWRTLNIPFADGGAAYFHACRTARWFTQFFANTFKIPAYGYHWYTTVSKAKDRFVWEGLTKGHSLDPIYIVGCPGRKSHGLLGSLGKYTGMRPIEEMKRSEPSPIEDRSYDPVAELYDEVFSDITVRKDECDWIKANLPTSGSEKPVALDLGCGNGALLRHLSPLLKHGEGVDASAGIIARAKKRQSDDANLSFTHINGPVLPFPEQSFDVVISMLSFRYLDWDPIMNEIRRVLKPGGRILIIDMVTAPVKLNELPLLVQSTLRTRAARVTQKTFTQNLQKMVTDPRWKTMLKHNPIRAEHEMKWYLESRFPGRKVEKLNIALHARILAFNSGPLQPGSVPPQSYP